MHNIGTPGRPPVSEATFLQASTRPGATYRVFVQISVPLLVEG